MQEMANKRKVHIYKSLDTLTDKTEIEISQSYQSTIENESVESA